MIIIIFNNILDVFQLNEVLVMFVLNLLNIADTAEALNHIEAEPEEFFHFVKHCDNVWDI